MTKPKCLTPDCSRFAEVREWCTMHYHSLWRAGELPPMPPNGHHRLTNVDVEAKTADCSICGHTRIRVRGAGRGHQCQTLRAAESRAYEARRPKRRSKASPERRREHRLRSKYGIGSADYEEMLAAQQGRCAICGETSSERLHVDHDHKTGAVRALLCRGCNTGIGHLREDTAAIRAALDYLKRHAA